MSRPVSVNHQSLKRKRVVASCSECYRRKQKCDRKHPCNNCQARNVSTQCVFDGSIPAARAKEPELSTSTAQAGVDPVQPPVSPNERLQGSVDLGYSLVSGSNAFVGLQEVLGNGEYQDIAATYNHTSQIALSNKGVEMLIAKLPPRTVTEALVDFFFDEVNWHYFILERLYFDNLFSRWPPREQTEPMSYLKTAELSTELQYFPSLLFQVIALSLQFMPPDWDLFAELSPAGIASSQTYSDLGDELLSLLGRPGFALTAVQADFLRSSWLKNRGRGIESWHVVGYAIRQAQELGLHRHKAIYQSDQTNVDQTLSLFWYEENKKRLWINLFIWDSFMAMILGRPRMIHMDDCDAKPPMNRNIPSDPSTAVPMALRPEDNRGIATVSALLFRYALACKVHEMRALKADQPHPKDYSVVRTIHGGLISLLDELPAFLRLKNSDTTWDLKYPYLPQLRQELQVVANLFLMTLHRPHVISNAESRKAALQAALETLDCQHRIFSQAKGHHYHLFGLAFYTIDASFLVSIITILFPPQDYEAKRKIDHSLQQAIESLSDMKAFNPTAEAGLDVLQRCHQKLKVACGSPSNTSQAKTTSYGTPGDSLDNLIRDLAYLDSDPFADPQPELSQPDTSFAHGPSPHILQAIGDSFNQTYWLDQLNMIHPSLSGQDSGNLWENVHFD